MYSASKRHKSLHDKKMRNQEKQTIDRDNWLIVIIVLVIGVFSYILFDLLRAEFVSGPLPPSAPQQSQSKSFQANSLESHPLRSGNNTLAIKDRATLDSLDIEVQALMNLNFKTRADVIGLRTEAVSSYPQLISGEYGPLDPVFGQIVNGLPWWGVLGAFCYGRGEKSIEGPSLQSVSILNPYLLVVPDFELRWRRSIIKQIKESPEYVPYCIARKLRWFPAAGRAEASYDGQCLMENGVSSFSLIAYNARDFNLNYIYVSYKDSLNIYKQNPPADAFLIPQLIHRGFNCGYQGGCNNVSPATPPVDDIRFTGFPAKTVVRLWTQKPNSVNDVPDMEYIIYFD